MALPRLKVINAESLDQAVTLAEQESVQVIGGGTDLLHGYKDSIYSTYADTLVNLRSLENLAYIREESDGVHIGALTTLHELENNSLLKEQYSVLAQAAYQVASPQIRNSASIAGNICQEPRCWYYRNADNGFSCLRKGGDFCNAQTGQNELHSVFGSARVKDTPCQSSCPSEIDIPVYMEMLRKGQIEEAAGKLMENNPLAALTGRVCPHFCQQGCNRGLLDESVSIRNVERALGNYILDHPGKFYAPPACENGRKAVIIGSGPSGLSAGYFLRKAGYAVTILEANDRIGGMLTYAIPAYRLPKSYVEKTAACLQNMGITFRCGCKAGKDITVEELRSEYDHVIFCCGAVKERAAGIEGDDGLCSGIRFLHDTAEGKELPENIRKAAVLGGGNAAMDVAVTLHRMGCETTVIYRRTRNEMPAIADDVDKALEEGLAFSYLTQPVKAERVGDKVLLTCVRMELGAADATGRARPVPVPGSEFTMEYDAVFTAFGEVPDLSILPDDLKDEKGKLQETPGVSGCGDFITGASTVTEAMCGGKKAALAIIKKETGTEDPFPQEVSDKGTVLNRFDPACLDESRACCAADISIAERNAVCEDNPGITIEQATEEARRCMCCGCVAACPSDIAPALLALDAQIITTKRRISAAQFWGTGICSSTILEKGELVREIFIPKAAAGTHSEYMKFRQRKAIDFPLVSTAISVVSKNDIIEDVRIVMGAAAPIPIRAVNAEKYLIGRKIDEDMAVEAGRIAVEQALPLKHNRYKTRILKAYIRRSLLNCR